jgi:DNA-binding PadR family transcriptional regulator
VDHGEMGLSENNRKARFYTLTAKGRDHLMEKTGEWQRLARAMGLVLVVVDSTELDGAEALTCSGADAAAKILPMRSCRIWSSKPMN